MYWIYFVCFLPYLLLDVASAECNVTQFWCSNGNCINMAWQCDGDDDCHDNSDEAECTATTCSDGFFRCDDGKCIPGRWMCDESPECPDESDEKPELCRNQTCIGFRCGNSSQCVPNAWKCDGQPDCLKGEDEAECNKTCDPAIEFQCTNNKCISSRWECDHHNDCEDGSDEIKCTKTGCDAAGEKMCSDGECINKSWWCDGDSDCKDGSDEANCTEKLSGQSCESTEFQCRTPTEDPECINAGWECDGHKDCIDGSDEEICLAHTCSPEEVNCDNHSCLREEFVCDQEPDCENGEDEKNCTYTDETCMNIEFDCGHKCISDEKICDGTIDCDNGADEAQCSLKANNTCKVNKGGCSQLCVPNANMEPGRRCECSPGYDFVPGSKTECQDFDECSVSGTCSQTCTNTKGSYKCECLSNYTLTDHRYCKADKGDTELIFSDRHDLRRYHLDTYHYSSLVGEHSSGAFALDFDIRNNIVVWSDMHSEAIHLANLTTGKEKRIIGEGINKTEGLAIDWIHGNLYLLDTGRKRIEVARLNGSCRKTLVEKDLAEPRALVLDPNSGWMYWTDWGNKPKIEKCAMNGQNRKVIVTRHIRWPNGLTIDYVQKRLYWADAKYHTIGSSDLDGNDYRMIVKDDRRLGHPFAITVFEDYLYWTDWMSNAVHRFSKFAHDNISTIALDLKMPMGIHVYHLYRQPVSMNRCGENNGGCSHLCLPVPQIKIDAPLSKKSVCGCPDFMVLDDNYNCKQSTKKALESYKDVTSPNQTNRPAQTSSMPAADKTTDGIEQTTQDAGVNKSFVAAQSESVGIVTGIVIIVLLGAGLVFSAAVFMLLKRHKSRNVKSMNFDNPVYRKTTTDDQLIMEKNEPSHRQSMQLLNPDSDECVIFSDRFPK